MPASPVEVIDLITLRISVEQGESRIRISDEGITPEAEVLRRAPPGVEDPDPTGWVGESGDRQEIEIPLRIEAGEVVVRIQTDLHRLSGPAAGALEHLHEEDIETGVLGSPWYTSRQAADYLRLKTTQGVRDAVRRGALRAHRRGHTYMFLQEDLDTYVCGRTERPGDRSSPHRPEKKPTPLAVNRPLRPIPAPAVNNDPYSLRSALDDDRTEWDPESHHRTGQRQPGQQTQQEKP